jgi:hypothetical protein
VNNTNIDTSQEAVDSIEIIEVDMNRTNTSMKDTDVSQMDMNNTDIYQVMKLMNQLW